MRACVRGWVGGCVCVCVHAVSSVWASVRKCAFVHAAFACEHVRVREGRVLSGWVAGWVGLGVRFC